MSLTRVQLPSLGYSDSLAFRQSSPGIAQEAINVVPRDPWQNRRRVGSRQGFVAVADMPAAVQWMGDYRLFRAGTLVQGVVVVAGGVVYDMTTAGAVVRASTATHALAAGDVIEAVVFREYVYLVNGRDYYRINMAAATPELEDWSPTDAPRSVTVGEERGNAGHAPTLITSFGSRLAVSGVRGSANNWWLSSANDPDDWTPIAGNAAGGIAGDNNPEYGELGEPVTAIFPFGGSGLMLATEGTLNFLASDPIFTDGRILSLSRSVGIAGPRAWCPGPEKTALVCATDGVYRVAPNDFDIDRGDRITADRLDGFFAATDFEDVAPVLAYDDTRRQVFLWANRTDEPGLSTHFVLDIDTGSWWPITLSDPRMPVVTSTTRFRPLAGERAVVWHAGLSRISTQPPSGVYAMDGAAMPGTPYAEIGETNIADAGVAFDASLLMGPVNGTPGRRVFMTEARVVLSADTQQDRFDADGVGPQLTVIRGESAQEAVGSSGDLILEFAAELILAGGTAEAPAGTAIDGGSAATPAATRAVGGFARGVDGRYERADTAIPGTAASYAGPGAYTLERDAILGWRLMGPGGAGGREAFYQQDPDSIEPAGTYPTEHYGGSADRLEALGGLFDARSVAIERALAPGMNESIRMRVRASDVYLGVESRGRSWAIEDMAIAVADGGPVRQSYPIVGGLSAGDGATLGRR